MLRRNHRCGEDGFLPPHEPVGRLWAVILAAGEGSRLRTLTTGLDGVPVPKQYCSFGQQETLLERTFGRARRLAAPGQIVSVVAKGHRLWWEYLLDGPEGRNLIIQPENRGTAVGILLPLLHVFRQDPTATVAILPSDHYVSREDVLHESLARLAQAVHAGGNEVVLLGMTAEHPDTELGWIVPETDALGAAVPIRTFVEKPRADQAAHLMAQGALWSSFVMAGRVSAFFGLFERTFPWLLRTFLLNLRGDAGWSGRALEELYHQLPSLDFSRDIVESVPELARVLRAPSCGWSDLGTPGRLTRALGPQAAKLGRCLPPRGRLPPTIGAMGAASAT